MLFLAAAPNTRLRLTRHAPRKAMVSCARPITTSPLLPLCAPECTCSRPAMRGLYMTGPPRTMTSAPAATAGEARDDDVEQGDNSGDDGLQDGPDAVDDGHQTGADGLEDGFNLRGGKRS